MRLILSCLLLLLAGFALPSTSQETEVCRNDHCTETTANENRESSFNSMGWDDLPLEFRGRMTAQGYTRLTWDRSDDEKNVVATYDMDWEAMPSDYRRKMRAQGYTQRMWDRSDHEKPFIETNDWEKLSAKHQAALARLGWDPVSYKVNFRPEISKLAWKDLTLEQQEAAETLGYQQDDWFLMVMDMAEEFEPVKLHFDLDELNQFGFDYLKTLTDVEVEVADGATVGDDMGWVQGGYSMAEYVEDALEGKSTLYLKYEDYDDFKKKLPSQLGKSVLTHLGDALKSADELRELGQWQSDFDEHEFTEYNWSIWVGGKNTSTAIHYDFDEFNFLWVLEGKKRVVLLPNDERTEGSFTCPAEAKGNNCWPGVDVLHSPELPKHAVEFILGPGDGISLPRLSWHAVQNLEPTVAYGFRVNGGFWDKPWSGLSEEDKETARMMGYDESSWKLGLTTPDEDDNDDDDDDEDEDEDFSDLVWRELPAEHRAEMQQLGYTEKMWDSEEDCFLDLNWDELSIEQRSALFTLGRGKSDSNAFGFDWKELTPEQEQAAQVLGYIEEDWHS